MAEIRVFMADDHAVVLEGLRALIDGQPGMTVVGVAGDGDAALETVGELHPDVIVIDISMPGTSGAPLAQRLRRACPAAQVLVLTVHEDRSYLRQLLEAGASGYVLKRAAAAELIDAIRAVAHGGIYIDSSLADHVKKGLIGGRPSHEEREPGDLTERESAVLQLIARGYSNKEIASQLTISVKTVETHKARAMERLNLSSRVDIVRYAVQQGWLRAS